MVSGFGWIDFSEKERQQMLDVVKLFQNRDTRDELGIGTIRDAFSEYFFPATSTIQTRARYFFFVPWIYQEAERKLQRKYWPADKIGQDIERIEKRLIRALIDGGEIDGVIGIEAKEKLVRLPSSIYWSGLKTLGIRLFEGSQAHYIRHLSRSHGKEPYGKPVGAGTREIDEAEPEGPQPTWHPGLPEPPAELLQEATLRLTSKEADYLRERVLHVRPDSLFSAFLLNMRNGLNTTFVWEHPIVNSLPEMLQSTVKHARNFSEMVHGASLLYNLMLSEKREEKEWEVKYRESIGRWAKQVSQRWAEIAGWCQETESFWYNPALAGNQIPPRTRTFVTRWLKILLDEDGPKGLAESKQARDLISSRELYMKGKRARLHGPEALGRWAGASGTAQLDFRWGITRRLLSDVYKGLTGEGEADA